MGDDGTSLTIEQIRERLPCSQEVPIRQLSGDMKTINNNVDRLCMSNESMIIEMRDMTKTLVQHMVENKEHHMEIVALKKDSDAVFKRVRRLEDDVIPEFSSSLSKLNLEVSGMSEHGKKIEKLEVWINKMKGVILIVPVSCTIIATIAAVVSIWLSWIK